MSYTVVSCHVCRSTQWKYLKFEAVTISCFSVTDN